MLAIACQLSKLLFRLTQFSTQYHRLQQALLVEFGGTQHFSSSLGSFQVVEIFW